MPAKTWTHQVPSKCGVPNCNLTSKNATNKHRLIQHQDKHVVDEGAIGDAESNDDGKAEDDDAQQNSNGRRQEIQRVGYPLCTWSS